MKIKKSLCFTFPNHKHGSHLPFTCRLLQSQGESDTPVITLYSAGKIKTCRGTFRYISYLLYTRKKKKKKKKKISTNYHVWTVAFVV
jgi:hypothetical protein